MKRVLIGCGLLSMAACAPTIQPQAEPILEAPVIVDETLIMDDAEPLRRHDCPVQTDVLDGDGIGGTGCPKL